jgi:ATP-dependent Lhr-like helicase
VSSATRLHPSVRYVLQANLGWTRLREIQEIAIDPILRGETTVIIAPTAGGKTEAVMLPLLSRILDEQLPPTSVLYIAPLRALLNDLAERIGSLARHLGLEVGVWHGDVAQRERARLAANRPDVLLTTPESLEMLLSFGAGPRRALLSSVRVIVIDEIHAFFGDPRGTHVLALMERLSRWAAHDVQRIGLSATIGNPDDLAAWLRGSSARPAIVVRPPDLIQKARREEFVVKYLPSLGEIVSDIAERRSGKQLVFCRSRSVVEELAAAARAKGLQAWPHHSALSQSLRREAESEFRAAPRGVLIATSTLELGIDIGDLDFVVQVDAPATVASMLQRLGRTGRRPGADARMILLARIPEQLLLCLAILRLHASAWVEPLAAEDAPYPTLVQQILASVVQGDGIAASVLADQLGCNAAFSSMSASDITQVIDHLISGDILTNIDGGLALGHQGDQLFSRRHFSKLAAVFSSQRMVSVLADGQELGTLQQTYVDDMILRRRDVFLLAGRAWRVVAWPDERNPSMTVKVTDRARAPVYIGDGVGYEYPLMTSFRAILSQGESRWMASLPPGSSVADNAVQIVQAAASGARRQGLDQPGCIFLSELNGSRLITYAGLRANRAIASFIRGAIECDATATNIGVNFRGMQLNFDDIVLACNQLRATNDLTRISVPHADRLLATDTVFARLLPSELANRYILARDYDFRSALVVTADPIRVVAMAESLQSKPARAVVLKSGFDESTEM